MKKNSNPSASKKQVVLIGIVFLISITCVGSGLSETQNVKNIGGSGTQEFYIKVIFPLPYVREVVYVKANSLEEAEVLIQREYPSWGTLEFERVAPPQNVDLGPVSVASGVPSSTASNTCNGVTGKCGGSLSWRNNNPGNIKATNGEFMTYPTEEAGNQAMLNDLKSKIGGQSATINGGDYNPATTTLEELLKTWVGQETPQGIENYISTVEKESGYQRNTPLSQLLQVEKVAKGIKVAEGYQTGTSGSVAIAQSKPLTRPEAEAQLRSSIGSRYDTLPPSEKEKMISALTQPSTSSAQGLTVDSYLVNGIKFYIVGNQVTTDENQANQIVSTNKLKAEGYTSTQYVYSNLEKVVTKDGEYFYLGKDSGPQKIPKDHTFTKEELKTNDGVAILAVYLLPEKGKPVGEPESYSVLGLNGNSFGIPSSEYKALGIKKDDHIEVSKKELKISSSDGKEKATVTVTEEGNNGRFTVTKGEKGQEMFQASYLYQVKDGKFEKIESTEKTYEMISGQRAPVSEIVTTPTSTKETKWNYRADGYVDEVITRITNLDGSKVYETKEFSGEKSEKYSYESTKYDAKGDLIFKATAIGSCNNEKCNSQYSTYLGTFYDDKGPSKVEDAPGACSRLDSTDGSTHCVSTSSLNGNLLGSTLCINTPEKYQCKLGRILESKISNYQWGLRFEKALEDLQSLGLSGLGRFSSIFIKSDAINQWRESVDNALCATGIFGGEACWQSKICGKYIDSPPQGTMLVQTPGGNAYAAAHIEGERTNEITFVGTEQQLDSYVKGETPEPPTVQPGEDQEKGQQTFYFYKITYDVQNPQDSGSMMNFNVVISGSSGSVTLYQQSLQVKPGKKVGRSGKEPIVQYSKKIYDKICIEFDQKQKFANKEYKEVCNLIKPYEGPATDYITKTEREFATSQGDAGNEADF